MAGRISGTSVNPSDSEVVFRQRLQGLCANYDQYESSVNQKAALRRIPLDDLTQIAEAKISSIGGGHGEAEKAKDMLLLELMSWFKEDFFSWMDKPKCPICSKSTHLLPGGGPVTSEERRRSASRVEIYTCLHCVDGKAEVARFPRYNDPVILLDTRTGRCGEWANCFALICRATGFEVRHVTDWTDHVWLEVFSVEQDRWLHCDPCENKVDSPLLYELGWGKSLSYVIAVSGDDIQDVTWRYSHSNNHSQVLARRVEVHESWLIQTILELRSIRLSRCSPERYQVLNQRLIKELVEFVCPTPLELGEAKKGMGGRESGSLAWRVSRQETKQEEEPITASSGFAWKIGTDLTLKTGKALAFLYDPVRDEYSISSLKESVRRGWSGSLWEMDNMKRKEEKDWKMVYIARNETQGNKPGRLAWKFEVVDTVLSIDAVTVRIPFAKFHSTSKVSFRLSTSSGESAIQNCCKDEDSYSFNIKFQSNVRWIVISCEVIGGEGSIAWQQAQLFRESMKLEIPRHPFVTIEIKSENS